jgi:hypothetical protein
MLPLPVWPNAATGPPWRALPRVFLPLCIPAVLYAQPAAISSTFSGEEVIDKQVETLRVESGLAYCDLQKYLRKWPLRLSEPTS